MPPTRFPRSFAFAVAAAALLGGACGKSPTAPAPQASVHRTVTVVVTDSLGSPRADCSLLWIALFDSAGVDESFLSGTDAQGTSTAVLGAGPWIVTGQYVPYPEWVAGGSFQVSGAQRALADTQVVRLVLHTASHATGTVLLAGRTEYGGTFVTSLTGGFSVTDSTGAWALGGLPPGNWDVVMYHAGFQPGSRTVAVTTPGSELVVPAVTLRP